MPAGNITQLERFKIIAKVKDLLDEGKSDADILEETGISDKTLRRYKTYLEEIAVADIDNEELAKRRGELYLELAEAREQARKLFEKSTTGADAIATRKHFMSWMDAIELQAKLFGLDNLKIGALTQINQQFNLPEPAKISRVDGEKIARLLKANHERKRRIEHESKKDV